LVASEQRTFTDPQSIVPDNADAEAVLFTIASGIIASLQDTIMRRFSS
jgi:hypothetical protein